MVKNKESEWPCMDCKKSCYKLNEYYMVQDTVWLEAISSHKGLLCVGCLESRLGRKLVGRDFILCPLNVVNMENGSKRLKDRIGQDLADYVYFILLETNGFKK